MITSNELNVFHNSHMNSNKYTMDYHDDYDKENCNIHQPRHAEKIQHKSSLNPLSERLEDLSTRSTKDSSPEYDHSSKLEDLFPSFSNVHHEIEQECRHLNTLKSRCTYCKDCGIFLPKDGTIVFREQMYDEKITLNPDEVYEIMLKNQVHNRLYNSNAPHLSVRSTITDWIFQVSQDLKISPDTTAAIIAYVDTIFCKVEVSKENLQLVVLSCLILATKFSEMDNKVPSLAEANNLCQGLYSIELFKKAESFILEQLEWNLRVISPYQFVHHFLSKGCIFSSDTTAFSHASADILRYLRRYSECFVNLSMDSYEFNQYPSHVVACAVIASTRKLIGVSPCWNSELEELTGTSWEVIESCFNKLYSCFESSFPEMVDLSKVLAQKTECQSQPEGQQGCVSETAMLIEESPENQQPQKIQEEEENINMFHEEEEIDFEKRESVCLKPKVIRKRKNHRVGKANKENKAKRNENNAMNIEKQSEFFDNSERRGHIKRNLIY